MAEPRLVVEHLQELDLAEHAAGHFHNGRSIAAFRLESMGLVERVLRTVGCLVLAPVMLWRTARVALGKGRPGARLVLLALPAMACFACSHAAGELAGYLAGPGTSPGRVK